VNKFNKYVSASAPGKCILFGEHAVVYGYPAISVGIQIHSKCIIEKINTDKILLDIINFNRYYKFENQHQMKLKLSPKNKLIHNGMQIMSDILGERLKGIKISISSDLISGAGLGSSASISVAFISAFNEYYKLDMNKDEISNLAFEMEKSVHNTPSGIDNTTCTFGNILYFKKKRYKTLKIPTDFEILITYTGIKHKTGNVVEKIRKLKQENPKLVEEIFSKIGELTKSAKNELEKGNIKEVGILMNKNQELLSSLNISNSLIDEINRIAIENNAYGSKLTGAGLGGCVITIGPNINHLLPIFRKLGYYGFITKIDYEGVYIE